MRPHVTMRPGNVILFNTPSKHSELQVGLVLSVWKGVKAPRLYSGETPIDSCVAFRAVELSMEDTSQEAATDWTCNSVSTAWVVRLEGLIAILDCESCPLEYG